MRNKIQLIEEEEYVEIIGRTKSLLESDNCRKRGINLERPLTANSGPY